MKVLAFDFGGTNTKVAIVDENNQLNNKEQFTSIKNDQNLFEEKIVQYYEKYKEEVDGIAISFAGTVDRKTGFIIQGGSYDFLMNFNLGDRIRQLCKCDVSILNDAEAAVICEQAIGNLIGCENGMGIIVGTGIGGGIILNGKLYSGSHNDSGEISSFLLNSDHPDYNNMLFSYCSHIALTSTYAKKNGIDPKTINGKIFFEHMDEEKIALLHRYGKQMATFIYNTQSVLDLEKYVIGGGISQQLILIDIIKEETEKLFENNKMFRMTAPQITGCKYHNDANLLGAAIYFKNRKE